MSILEKYSSALKNKDEVAMNELLHDDFKFTMHKSGNVLGKGDVIKWAMSGDINQDKTRVVYENDEVGVHHAFHKEFALRRLMLIRYQLLVIINTQPKKLLI